jgi:hypothetical protein
MDKLYDLREALNDIYNTDILLYEIPHEIREHMSNVLAFWKNYKLLNSFNSDSDSDDNISESDLECDIENLDLEKD